jgi:hypothetical protein
MELSSKMTLGAAGVFGAAGLTLLGLVAISPGQFVYDEPSFVQYVHLLHEHGLTPHFLNSLTGTVGPLYAFIHAAVEPVTQLQPVRMRFVNVFLLSIVALILVIWLKRRRAPNYWLAGASVLAIPMTWVLAGMALSEMPAVLFVTASLLLQLRGLEALSRGQSALPWFLVSSILLAIAVWGRQPYLLLVGVPVLLALLEPRLRLSASVFVVVVVVCAISLFVIWQGLVPPSHHGVQRGLSPVNGLLSLGYAGFCFFLLAPQARWLSAKAMVSLFVSAIALNAMFGVFLVYPLRSAIDRYLPDGAVQAYGVLCGSLLLTCGAAFLIRMLYVMWNSRADLEKVAINSGLLCIAISPVFIGHQYSSRYTAMFLPYLVLAAQPWRMWNSLTLVTAIAGCTLGALSLLSYVVLCEVCVGRIVL